MELNDLLQRDVLEHQLDLPGRNLLLRIGDRIDARGLAARFKPYQGEFASEITSDAEHIRLKLLSSLTANIFAQAGEPGATNSTRAALRRRISGKYVQKLKEVSAIGRFSGSIKDPHNVYLVDACGGVGILSSGISFLRGEPNRTSADCVDISEERSHRHDLLRRSLAGGNPHLHRRIMDINEFTPQEFPDRETYWMAKHPCGHAVDIIIEKLRKIDESRFPHTTLMTCCHGAANTHFPFRNMRGEEKVFLDETEWLALTSMTSWVDSEFTRANGDEVTTEHKLVGRVAMRLIDLQRAAVMPQSLNPRVQELLPPEVSSRNHGIIVNCA